LFKDVATLEPEPTLVPYDVTSPLWSDGALKRRWIVPVSGKQVDVGTDGSFTFPIGTMFVKHFELPPTVTPRERTRRLETRIMVVGSEATYGLSYRWNREGTDADLVVEPDDETIVDAVSGEARNLHFPSFGQCWSCHRAENRTLGFTAGQLRGESPGSVDQLTRLAELGVIDAKVAAKLPRGLASPGDTTASLDA